MRDPRIDAYIRKAPEFARPILTCIREVVHEACPEVEETLKWSSPTFTYHGILCGMSAFKQHAVFILWKGKLLLGEDRARVGGNLTSVEDLPPRRTLISLIRKAAKLNEKGVKLPRKLGTARKPLPVPPELEAALAKSRTAAAAFKKMPPSHQREYSEWIGEAKKPETRARRVETAMQWIAEGKSRNWKYEKTKS